MNSNKKNIDNWIELIFSKMLENLRFLFFVFLLCMTYIWNNHMAQKLITDMNIKAKDLKELRWDYLTKKSELMYKSKITEVLPKAESMGLGKLENPPYKIRLKSKDYKKQD